LLLRNTGNKVASATRQKSFLFLCVLGGFFLFCLRHASRAVNSVVNLQMPEAKTKTSRPHPFTFKIMTYNIHRCVNIHGRFAPEQTVRVIKNSQADLIALQEVTSISSNNPQRMHQSRFLAARLNMIDRFFPLRPLLSNSKDFYGIAILSRYPMTAIKIAGLPDATRNQSHEPRGAMWMRVHTPLGDIHLINTHLSLYRRDRLVQAAELLGRKWLGRIPRQEPVILCGDLNAGSYSLVYRNIRSCLADVQLAARQKGYPKATFFSFYRILRLDHIFVSDHFTALRVNVPTDPVSRRASDHLPLLVELGLGKY
jgi:endonuclease/exonuclease/phosphatase family metal-dependent hydrolase